MNKESKQRLQRNLAAATDEALTALATRGLVRRATKDFASATELRFEETEEAAIVFGDGWTVTMPPEGPAAATDDTPATGVTRQILVATMFLRQSWQSSTEVSETSDLPEEAEDSVDKVSEDAELANREVIGRLENASWVELSRWAGKTPLLEACATFKPKQDVTIEHLPQLTIRFADDQTQVFLMTDRPAKSLRGLLGQFKSTAKKTRHPQTVLLAVLAIKQAAGKSVELDGSLQAGLDDAVREDRVRVAHAARKLTSAFARSGIAHPSKRLIERLQGAAVSAEAARFPRLAKLLNSLAEDAALCQSGL